MLGPIFLYCVEPSISNWVPFSVLFSACTCILPGSIAFSGFLAFNFEIGLIIINPERAEPHREGLVFPSCHQWASVLLDVYFLNIGHGS